MCPILVHLRSILTPFCPIQVKFSLNRIQNFYTFWLSRQRCLGDIKAALMFGYPKELCYKVFERQGRCLEKLGHSIDAVDSLEESIKRLDVSKLEGKKKETYAEDLRKRLDTIKKTGTKKARK